MLLPVNKVFRNSEIGASIRNLSMDAQGVTT